MFSHISAPRRFIRVSFSTLETQSPELGQSRHRSGSLDSTTFIFQPRSFFASDSITTGLSHFVMDAYSVSFTSSSRNNSSRRIYQDLKTVHWLSMGVGQLDPNQIARSLGVMDETLEVIYPLLSSTAFPKFGKALSTALVRHHM